MTLSSIVPAARADTASPSDAVVHWNEIAQNAVVPGRPVGSALVLEGIVAVAIYDAAAAVEGGLEPFVSSPGVPHRASLAATVATAARDVLVEYVDDVAGRVDYVENAYAGYLAGLPDDAATRNGIRVGHRIGEDLLAWRSGDGFDNAVPYIQPPPGPGVFEPVPTPTPVDVKLTQVRPLTFAKNDRFRPDGPGALTSARYAQDFNEVKTYGRADSAVRTFAQTQIALVWSENTAIQWPRTLRALATARGLDAAETARMFAMTLVAGADSILGCFDAKYHYLFWRPIHAIQRADTDGNPATDADPTWRPLLFVNHPEYPGAHGCYTTAITRALAAFFGTDAVQVVVSSPLTGATYTYQRLSDIAEEVYDARTWAGLHLRSSTMAGAEIGRRITERLVAKYFRTLD